MSVAELTICSVSCRSGPLLDLNQSLARQLNAGTQLAWILADNTPVAERVTPLTAGADTVIFDGPAYDAEKDRPGSYHHAVALNEAIRRVTTRFALVLDPDFFLVRPEWAREVLKTMQGRGLAVFGVPWHPRWHTKYRYFPCAHCLFLDLDQIDATTVDFRPGQGDEDYGLNPGRCGEEPELLSRVKPWVPGWLRRAARPSLAVIYNLRHRRAIGRSHDTGYRLWQRYANDPRIRWETAEPVYRLPEDYPVQGPRTVSRLLDAWLPDQWSYVPKRPGAFTSVGWRELAGIDVSATGWEEFVWRGAPFGMHVRGRRRVPDPQGRLMLRLTETLERVTGISGIHGSGAMVDGKHLKGAACQG